MAFGLMFFITVLMFGALKQPIVIWLTVPMIICGVAIGLIITDLPLTFPFFSGRTQPHGHADQKLYCAGRRNRPTIRRRQHDHRDHDERQSKPLATR